MTLVLVLLIAAVAICTLSAVLATINVMLYARPRAEALKRGDDALPQDSVAAPLVSICVPARNEAANLEACVRGLLAQRGATVEVLVYDDQSTDGTDKILARLIAEDARVRAVATHPLPADWNGKQHGCHRMGEAARGAWLLFTDADVRFEPDAVALALAEATRLRADLVSTFPRQITGSMLERLVVPLIHFILLSYLPFPFMRSSKSPGASAGCGQFLLVRRDMWQRAGGHAEFRASMHDGIRLPRRVREVGGRTDLFDATDLVSCRMYRDFRSCWSGFAKNAYEGLGSFTVLCVFTVLHLVAHVFPWLWLMFALGRAVFGSTDTVSDAGGTVDTTSAARGPSMETILALAAVALALGERAMLALRFRQSWMSVILHPIGILLMTAIQWHSMILAISGRRAWRGRQHGALQSTGRSGMLSGHG